VGQITTTMTYDTQGNNLTVTDPENHTTQYLYDDLGNRAQQDSPDTGITTCAHNKSGQVVSQTDARGQITVFAYDAAGRLTNIDRTGSDYDVTYTFDTCTNGSARLCQITTGWGHTIGYEWNAIGELVSVTSNEGQIKYSYGPQNTLTSIEYPSGRIVRFDLDGGGLPVSIQLSLDGLPVVSIVDQIEYSPLGLPITWHYANGQTTTVSLDSRHRPTAIDVPGVWNWQANQYDANDNILNLTNAVETFSYGYDALDRLTAADTASQTIGFTYDDVGNRLSKTIDLVPELGSYETGSNRIVAYGDKQYTLDLNGNTTSVSVNQILNTTYVYSSHDRLIEVIDDPSSSTLATYRYDALGQRVEKVSTTETRKFIYGLNGELLVEMDGTGAVLHEYVYLQGNPVVGLSEIPNGPPPPPPPDIIIDNDSVSAYAAGSNWKSKNSSAVVNGSYIQNRKRSGRSMRWIVDESQFPGGYYDVYVKWLTSPRDGFTMGPEGRYGTPVAA